jgi:hypothetical protein
MPVHRFVRWPVTRYWLAEGWAPLLMRNKIYHTNPIGSSSESQRLYARFMKECNVTSMLSEEPFLSRSGRQQFLSEYASVGASAVVTWFEDSERPSTLEGEAELKKASSFQHYHSSGRVHRSRSRRGTRAKDNSTSPSTSGSSSCSSSSSSRGSSSSSSSQHEKKNEHQSQKQDTVASVRKRVRDT